MLRYGTDSLHDWYCFASLIPSKRLSGILGLFQLHAQLQRRHHISFYIFTAPTFLVSSTMLNSSKMPYQWQPLALFYSVCQNIALAVDHNIVQPESSNICLEGLQNSFFFAYIENIEVHLLSHIQPHIAYAILHRSTVLHPSVTNHKAITISSKVGISLIEHLHSNSWTSRKTNFQV